MLDNIQRVISSLSGSRQEEPDFSGENVDQLHAWSISARLAAVSPRVCELVPQEIADLINEARSLHPEMAEGADRRDAQDENRPKG